MKGRLIKYTISAVMLATMLEASPTFAQVTQDQINTTKNQINATQGQISATQNQIDDFETKVQQLDNQITIEMVKSQKLDSDIKVQQGKIEKTKADVEKAKQDLEAHKAVYAARLQSIQSQGQEPIITYTEILLSSKNLSEFLTRSTAISQILQSDTDLLNTLLDKEQALKDIENKLNDEIKISKNEQSQLAIEQKQIEVNKQEVENELANSKNILQQQQTQQSQQTQQLAQQQSQLKAQQEAEQRAQALARQQAQQLTSGTNSSSNGLANSLPASGGASQVITYAERFLGVPYVWGGSSPGGFDCSGLMQYVFRSVGVYLPRVASDQQNYGTRITPYQVQPGDLVFKGDPAYHVGLYIGGGEWIQAPETGDVVKISPYNPASFSSAARVF